MSSSFGGTVKLTGESEYRKALREITSNLKQVSSELKLTNVQFNSGDKTIKDTKTSYTNMNTTIQQQKEKISSLRQALKEAESQYGSNNEKVKNFKTQLNNAETQLIEMESATNKSNKELKEMKNGFDDAGQGALKFGDLLKANVLGDAIVGGIKALGNVVKEVGSTILNIGKEALNSYADYEQLVGGVDTLFGESSGKVQKYAAAAYETAGVSANDYMETVTSFSASLLQSLKGDTDKAAESANQALIDMSDNANKMGTDMSMIQSAYQGFAKQNYTMLDNLKLGYGGTKTEMERLLKDAQKISGVKYDINNLNDVYSAIHVIQTELGITGTTAKEASTTIQGSITSMKSAYSNLLAGLADDNADLTELTLNLIYSVETVAKNVLPAIQKILSGVSQVLPELFMELGSQMPQMLEIGIEMSRNLLNGIRDSLFNSEDGMGLIAISTSIIETLLNGIIELLPDITKTGMDIILGLIQGLAESLPELIPTVVDAMLTIVDTLLDNIDLIIDGGIQLLLALADGLIEALPQLIEKAPVIIQKLFDAFVINFPKIVKAGGELIGKLVAGITGSFWKLLEVAPQLISNIVKGLSAGWSEMQNTGKYLIEGLWDGIKGMASWVTDKIKGFATNILDNMKEALGIHSPSTLFRDEVGKNIALGVGEGFSSTMKDVSQEMANSIPTKFDINSALNTTNNSNSLTLENLTGAFIKGVKNLNAQIIIDKDVAGRFIITSVNTRLGEVM